MMTGWLSLLERPPCMQNIVRLSSFIAKVSHVLDPSFLINNLGYGLQRGLLLERFKGFATTIK